MSLYHKYNNENILIRAVLAGLLDILNNQIKYEQAWADDDIETVQVPWFYNQSGDERFNQDFYTHYAECMPPRPVDGNFDVIPRGVITYTGSSIVAQRITSRYVQGRYVKEVDGQLESYVSYLYSIPLSVRIDCEIWCDRQITALKIEQAIREVFYKTVTYYVYFRGLRIGSTVGFPEDITLEKNIQYSFEPNNPIKVNFQLEIETYQPVFDPTTEMKTTSRIKGFSYNLYPVPEKNNINTITPSNNLYLGSQFQIVTPREGATIPKGTPVWVEWVFNDRGKIINKVNLQWAYYGQNEFYDIELAVPNHEYYVWNIPDTFTDFKEPHIIWEETNDIKVTKVPIVKIIPDLVTRQISSTSFEIIDEGYFTSVNGDTSINLQLEMRDRHNEISYSPDGAIWGNIQYNTLTSISVDPSTLVYFPEPIDFKHIDIYITNTNDGTTFGIANNIKIV
jgi:hypothetical protein